MLNANRAELQRELLYEFENANLLAEALRHSSFVNEQADIGMRDNERLEFLGDGIKPCYRRHAHAALSGL